MYRAITRNIEFKVTPRFLPDRSSHEKSYFFEVLRTEQRE